MTEEIDNIFNEIVEDIKTKTIDVEKVEETLPYAMYFDVRTDMLYNRDSKAYDDFISSPVHNRLIHFLDKLFDAYFSNHTKPVIEHHKDNKSAIYIIIYFSEKFRTIRSMVNFLANIPLQKFGEWKIFGIETFYDNYRQIFINQLSIITMQKFKKDNEYTSVLPKIASEMSEHLCIKY